MKAGDLVRNRYDHPCGGVGVVTDEEPQTGELGTYYRIYMFTHNQTIWGNPREWEVLSESW
tara:strand:- start:169 stop:351 length:183 start_codon:yes stop_codon:yes gene_type:complete